MRERVWFRSLYWRVALGFVAFLAVVLIVQGGILFWLVARSSDSVAGRSPLDLATFIASDLSAAMADRSIGDPGAYLADHYGNVSRVIAVVMADGTVHYSKPGTTLAPPLLEMAKWRLRSRWRGLGAGRDTALGAGEPGPRFPGPGPMPWGFPPETRPESNPGAMPGGGPGPGLGVGPDGRPLGPANDPLRRPPRQIGMAPVLKDGAVAAVVVIPPAEPLPAVLRQFAPAALAIALGLLVVATSFAALFVFRPAQRRLQGLEDAAHRLGAGEWTARAPVAGADEVTAVARAFNTMADELDRRATALQQATDARRQLLADVSHELMTPLTAIRGYLETLEMAELQLDDAARRRYLAIVNAEAGRLEHIIGDLLDMARLEAGGGTLVFGDVDVHALFTRVLERHERAAREKGIRLELGVAPTATVLPGDSARLEQVLQNLAANALRHTPAGGAISLESEPGDGAVVLRVRDTGEGIPIEHLPRVFDRFYKADEARGADGRGSGLGLSIAKAIVERHGGTITVRSEPGRDTVFEIVLPLSPSGPDAVIRT